MVSPPLVPYVAALAPRGAGDAHEADARLVDRAIRASQTRRRPGPRRFKKT
jgi:hypothetical protein